MEDNRMTFRYPGGRWFKLGDVPEANVELFPAAISKACHACSKDLLEHGRIKVPAGGFHIVCPGDHVFQINEHENYIPMRPNVFNSLYRMPE